MPNLSNDYERLSNAARDFLFQSHRMLINGRMVGAKSGAELSVTDPTNLLSAGQVPPAAEADVNLTVEAARRASESGAWRGATSSTRERLILRLAELVEQDRTLFAEIEAVGGVKDSGLGHDLGRGSRAAELSDQGQCRQYHLNQRPEFAR